MWFVYLLLVLCVLCGYFPLASLIAICVLMSRKEVSS